MHKDLNQTYCHKDIYSQNENNYTMFIQISILKAVVSFKNIYLYLYQNVFHS